MADRFLMHWCCRVVVSGACLGEERSCPLGLWTVTYGVSLDVSVNQLVRLGIHGDGAGDKDEAVGDNGLAVDAGERLGGLVGEDCLLAGHCSGCVWCKWRSVGQRMDVLVSEAGGIIQEQSWCHRQRPAISLSDVSRRVSHGQGAGWSMEAALLYATGG